MRRFGVVITAIVDPLSRITMLSSILSLMQNLQILASFIHIPINQFSPSFCLGFAANWDLESDPEE
jgi:hypothetical protein